MPLASRRLGRKDEPWLLQVIVRLRVIETHLALYSLRHFVQIDHLQMSVKLAGAEVDALYLATQQIGAGSSELIVCCEAKGRRDDILEDQIMAQVRAVFSTREIVQDTVIPMAVKALRPRQDHSEVHVIEFDAVSRSEVSALTSLTVASEAVFELHPPVPGIGA